MSSYDKAKPVNGAINCTSYPQTSQIQTVATHDEKGSSTGSAQCHRWSRLSRMRVVDVMVDGCGIVTGDGLYGKFFTDPLLC